MFAKISGLLTVSLLALSSAANADVSISSKPTTNMSCATGVCTATAAKAVLNTGDLQTMLASGDVAVKTGSIAKDIAIDQPLTWATTGRLTLDAQQSVTIKKQVIVSGTGNITITTNDGGSGGDLQFENRGSATFADTNSSLVINAQTFTLVQDIATLAADIAANPSGAYALANSYDAKKDVFDSVPVPTPFSGTFEGLGQTISHLKIKHDLNSYEGLFYDIGAGALVRDLDLAKANIHVSGDANAGVLAGANSEGRIIRVSVEGTLLSHGIGAIGGLVGINNGSIAGSRAAVNVTGRGYAGGLVGASGQDSSVDNCHATGAIVGGAAGGLAANGYNITRSSATGFVTGADSLPVGGLVGSGSHIDQSFATGAVSGGSNLVQAGGLAGVATFISNSYATGSVQVGSHRNRAGGLVGYGLSTSTSYSLGPAAAGARSEVGGLLGRGNKSSMQDYWDTDTSGIAVGCGKGDCSGIAGLTDTQLKSGLPAGFNPKIWSQSPDINGGYPYLLANRPE